MRLTVPLAVATLFLAGSALHASPADRALLTVPVSVDARPQSISQQGQTPVAPGKTKGNRADKKHAKEEAVAQTFAGTVEWEYKPLSSDCDVPNCDHFALFDDATKSNYEIDDARAALPFEGKRAKITGVLDKKTSVIHLLSIEETK